MTAMAKKQPTLELTLGARVYDTALKRYGTLMSVNLDTKDVSVSWRRGQVTTLRPADIASGRYELNGELPVPPPEGYRSRAARKSAATRDRARGGPPREPKPHGTYAAARRHMRAKEPMCAPCHAAWLDYQAEQYLKKKAKREQAKVKGAA